MAYGMQIPQMSFPYFYPTKIPTSIPAPSSSNEEPPKSHANIIMYNSRSSGPLNFSKRDTNFNDNDESVENQKGHHRMYSPPTISKYRDDHKTNNVSEQEDAAEENIEVDSI